MTQKEKYYQIIDDAHWNYMKSETDRTEKTGQTWTPLSIEEFIGKCKTDSEFSEKWGLKIEEKVLDYWDLKQRAYGYNNLLENHPKYNPKYHSKIKDIDKLSKGELMTILQTLPTPSKLITLTYNNETIESYE